MVSTKSNFNLEVLANKTVCRFCPPSEIGRTNSLKFYNHEWGSNSNASIAIRTSRHEIIQAE